MAAPYKRIIALDYETAWCRQTYTLSKMTTEEYIRDPRFKAWGCSYYYLDELDSKPKWVSRKDLPKFFGSIDWSTTAALAHNSMFDIAILAWVYGHVPCFIFDSLSMARALYGTEVGNSLAKLATRFNLPPKGKAVHSTDGMLEAIPPHVEAELAEYCDHDVALCVAIFDKMSEGYPTKELRLIDMTLRMFIEPKIQLDKRMLVEAIGEEKSKREGLLAKLQIEEKDLASNPKFAAILEGLGVEPPMKKKKATVKTPNPVGMTYAFAKKDAGFQMLLNGDREDLVLLCEARLMVKSTLERTRGQRFLDIAQRGLLPVPLGYYRAHTGRWAGMEGINLQNLGRGSFLRSALVAPDGYMFVVADLSQIEPRVLAYLADYRDMLKIFASGRDAYAEFGTIAFGTPVTAAETPELRQASKALVLGAGFGLGWASFASQLMTGFLGAPPVLYGIGMAKQVGVTVADVENFVSDPMVMAKMKEMPHNCTNDELVVHCTVSARIIDIYRTAAHPVKRFWRLCDDLIAKCLSEQDAVSRFGGGKTIKHKCLTFSPGQILLPNGMTLKYPDLQGKPDESGWVQWTYGVHRKKLFGGKATENVVSSVARIVMSDGLLRCQERYPCVLTVHDEGVFLVPEDEVSEAKKWIHAQMIMDPSYMPGIPLGATIGSGKRYGEAK